MSDEFPRLTPYFTDLPTESGALPIAEIRLGPLPRGAALVLCDGGSLDLAAAVMNGLAQQGYESLAADLSERPDGATATLLGRLGDRGWKHEQIGVVGYGLGGRGALRAAARFTLGAAVSVAPVPPRERFDPVAHELAGLRTPWLCLTGDTGSGGTGCVLDRLDAIRRAQAPVHTELVRYSVVPEHFYTDISDTVGHAAAFDAWQRIVEWLNLRVVPRLTPRSLAWRAQLPAAAGKP